MILLGLGANLPSAAHGAPQSSLEAALRRLGEEDTQILTQSRWYRSAPVPASGQPWFINGVAIVATRHDPVALLELLHRIEGEFGRSRRIKNEARVLDLDLLDYDGKVAAPAGSGPLLPHPRLHEREFVLRPLAEIAPFWRHPVLGLTAKALLAALPGGQAVWPIE
jgi:2-amino-4-hydroxy-6-hydroxymethyldihydropteridine diphosphokinase